ncbi:MAG: glycine cleavage system protein GcvH [Calditrichales bacterium]|nr:MAG: glycine cleavage system protein GcvH [Calditrichales bacterium]
MNIPEDLRYTEDHEWARLAGDVVTVGITDYAQGELGDVVYLDLPSVGDQFKANDTFGSIEAVKAAADLYLPVTGEIVEVNQAVADTPETINSDPYGDGWMVKIKVSDPTEFNGLMDSRAYQSHIGQ